MFFLSRTDDLLTNLNILYECLNKWSTKWPHTNVPDLYRHLYSRSWHLRPTLGLGFCCRKRQPVLKYYCLVDWLKLATHHAWLASSLQMMDTHADQVEIHWQIGWAALEECMTTPIDQNNECHAPLKSTQTNQTINGSRANKLWKYTLWRSFSLHLERSRWHW